MCHLSCDPIALFKNIKITFNFDLVIPDYKMSDDFFLIPPTACPRRAGPVVTFDLLILSSTNPRGTRYDAGPVLPDKLCVIPAAVLVCVSPGQDVVEQSLLSVWFISFSADIHGCKPLLV